MQKTKSSLTTYLFAIIDLSSQPLVWNFEAILLGRLSANALAGGGMAGQILLFISTLFLTFGIGGSLVITRYLGQKQYAHANHMFSQSILLSFLTAIPLSIIGYFTMPFVFGTIFGAPHEVKMLAVRYARVLLIFLPMIATNFTCIALIRGWRDTFWSMCLNVGTNGLSAFLAIGLIFGKFGFPEMGIKGAAVAIGISYTIGLFAALTLIFKRKTRVNFRKLRLGWIDPKTIVKLFKVGFPITTEQMIWLLGQLILLVYVGRLTSIEIAIHQALVRLQMFLAIVYQAIGIVALSVVSESIGGKSSDEHLHRRKAFKVMIVSFSVFGLIFLIFPKAILSLFLPDPTFLAVGSSIVRFMALLQVGKAIVVLTSSLLRAKGQLYWLVKINGYFVMIFETLLGWIFVNLLNLGLFGVWGAMGLDEAFKTLVHFQKLRKTEDNNSII